MKEGLRSGNTPAKPETDKVSPGRAKKGNDIKQHSFDLNDDVTQITDSGNDEPMEDGLDGNERKQSRVDGVTVENEADSAVKKRAKDNGQMQNVGRVLRSRSRVESGSDGGYEKERVVVDMGMEESHQLDDGKVRKKVKGKRGRPPKAPESDASSGEKRKKLKVKRGRPPKAKTDGSYRDERKEAKTKRGRPSNKQQDSDESDHGRSKKRLKGKRGRPPKDQGTNGVLKTNFSKGKKINGTRITRKVKFEKRGEKKGTETNQEISVSSTRSEKQLLRERIIELLLGAGWTIEYRPRYGREYNDAVYVNPEGKTHWSVTKAYRVLKNHYEEGGNSNTGKTGFTFTPIPEDELKILRKEVNKIRSDKNKKKSKKKLNDADANVEPVIGKKKNKRKLLKGKPNSAASSGGKSLKRGTKGKPSHGKQGNSVARNRKQGAQNRKRCRLLVRKSVEGADCDSDGYVPYDGKRTVLAWMIDLGTVPLNGKVEYCNQRKTRVMHQGTITKDGIRCDCCAEIFSISKFEAHVGAGTNLCNPFQNLYLESGTPLLQCILDSWSKQDESERKGFHFVEVGGEDPNDDTCGICGDGGDLICCDSCPSTFHQSCLDIKRFPSGKWNCVYCLCKFCGAIDENTCQMVDHDDSAISTLLICSLCEEKYHQSCIPAEDAINDDSSSPSFCGKKCQQIFERLQMLLGVKHQLDEGYTWTLICRDDVGSNLSLNHVRQKVECNAKLAVALLVMDECFLPMPDHRSGINLIHNIVYNFGSNFNRLNYSGFFTVILERDDEMIAAASIRIHGNELAEMPFIGTRYMYRRQGMCRRLLAGIESALYTLNVERLVIPAVAEVKETWTSGFGFKPVEASSRQKMRNMHLLVFPGVDMLQKPVLKHQFAVENKIPAEGVKFCELEEHQTMDEVADTAPHDESAAVESSVQLPVESSHNTSDMLQKPVLKHQFAVENKIPAEGVKSNELEEHQIMDEVADTAPHDEFAAVESSLQLPVESSHNTSDVISKTLKFSDSITDTKCISQLGVIHDDVQESDKTAMNPLVSMSDADAQNKEISDHGGEFHHASRLATKSIGSEVKSEDVIVQHNNFGDEASAHQSAEKTTDNQNLDLLQESIHSGETYFTHESEAKYLMTDDAKVTAGCCTTDTKCINQLVVVYDDVQGNDKTVTNPLGFVSDAGEENKEFSDCGVEFRRASKLATKSISKVESEDVIVKHNNVADEASVHHLVENNTADVQNLDLFQESKVSTENFFTEESEAKYPMTDDAVVTSGSCKTAVSLPEEESCSLDGNPVADRSQMNDLGSDSQVHQSSIMHSNSESLCDSSPGSSVAPHCSSGGGNSCATAEAIILSNQAS
ncbi:hypothetical protein Dsin_025072 [Dipteronia sinensis]|uniref:PHD-type domain-containing protein n=1 Tax=Dipteronia sinensis TaxID=43782 RepID=A0AAD9ZV59_9ROSI|nr:hypothetical protein Dsin_025072 [Dipteronia sinensis]